MEVAEKLELLIPLDPLKPELAIIDPIKLLKLLIFRTVVPFLSDEDKQDKNKVHIFKALIEGDGTCTVLKKLFTCGWKLAPNNQCASDCLPFLIFMAQDDNINVKNAIGDLFKKIMNIGILEVDGYKFEIDVKFGGDMKWLWSILAFGCANGIHPCFDCMQKKIQWGFL